jgi:hypothetical protein
MSNVFGLLDALEVTQAASKGSIMQVVSRVISMSLRTFPNLDSVLRSLGWTPELGFNVELGETGEWQGIASAVNTFIEKYYFSSQNKVTALVNFLRSFNVEVLLADTAPRLQELVESIRSVLVSYTPGKNKEIVTALRRLLENEVTKDEGFHLSQLAKILEGLGNGTTMISRDICAMYVNRTALDEEAYPEVQYRLTTAIGEGKLHEALYILNQCTYPSRLFKFHDYIYEKVKSLREPETLKILMKSTSNSSFGFGFEAKDVEDLWRNPKFEHWVLENLSNDALIETIHNSLCQTHLPLFLPRPVLRRMRELMLGVGNEEPTYAWTSTWPQLQSFIETLQVIVTRNHIPRTFLSALRDYLEKNPELRVKKEKQGVLFHWIWTALGLFSQA